MHHVLLHRRMVRFLICLVLLVSVVGGNVLVAVQPARAQASQEPVAQVDEWKIDRVVDWQAGATENVLVTNNAGGELRLDADETEGFFISQPLSATFSLNAAGAFWRADIPSDTELVLEVRGRSTPPRELPYEELAGYNEGWGPWQRLVAADARSKREDGALASPDVLAFDPDTRYLQLRATLSSSVPNASPVFNEITIVYFNTMQGPSVPAGMPRVPIFFGPDTLTARPMVILRSTWSASRRAAQPDRARPYGIVLHQVNVVPPIALNTPALLRALAHYQSEILGWDDMTYHYLIDETGTLYEGRLGGPLSEVSRLAAGDTTIHIALIGNIESVPSNAARATLTHLLAWLCEAYEMDPFGTHEVAAMDEVEQRDDIVGHHDIVAAALDPGEPLHEIWPEILESTNDSIIRSRWYFPEGNIEEYRQRLMFFNPTDEPATADVTFLYGEAASPIIRPVTIPAGKHAELVVNDVLSDTTSLSTIVDSSTPILAERSMELPTDINASPGVSEVSRIWYFAEGSTDDDFDTYLVLFNPHNTMTDATITYMKGDGITHIQTAHLPPRQRLVITVKDFLPEVGFGVRIIAERPIAAERTLRFGTQRSGMHMGPGTPKLSRTWYFAEGTTDFPFQMKLLILNPNDQYSNTTVTFMTPDGTSLKRQYAIPPTTRLVVDVNEVVPALGVATVVQADRPLAAERALYFNARLFAQQTEGENEGEGEGDAGGVATTTSVTATAEVSPTLEPDLIDVGTVSFGAYEPAYTWHFAYGRTQDTRQYVLLSNPSRGQARVVFDFVLSDGSRDSQSVIMPAGSRYTLAVQDFYPDQSDISVVVRSTQPIVVERSLFADNGMGGATSVGIPEDDPAMYHWQGEQVTR